jgi:hypothetical protein
MIGEEIADLSLKVVREMRLRDGERIVLAGPIDYKWRHMSSINHNVFRLDMSGNIIWQVRRKEILFAGWGKPDKTPVIIDPAFATEDCDSFASMGTHFFVRRPSDNNQPYLPKFNYEYFEDYAPGRLLAISTYELEYDLDPETGIAACTGVPVN